MFRNLRFSAVLFAVLGTTTANAERPGFYQPPAIHERFVSALTLVGGAATLLSVALLVLQRATHPRASIDRARYRMFAGVAAVLGVLGIAVSTAQLSFGENRNPEWVGSFFVALIFPAALLFVLPGKPGASDWVVATLLTPAVWISVFFALSWSRHALGLVGW